MMKAHFRDSDVPLKQGTDINANCGATVPKATALLIPIDGEVEVTSSVSNICRVCQKVPRSQALVYRYLLAAGQEVENQAAQFKS
jgi:hypothetical protein